MKKIIGLFLLSCMVLPVHAGKFGSQLDPFYVISVTTASATLGDAYVTGNVGIGTTNPVHQLDIVSATSPTGYVLSVSSQNVAKMFTVTGNGDVYIGQANHVSTITASGGISADSFTGSGAGLTAITAANISGGILGITVKHFQSTDCEALTPAAEGEFCYDTNLHTMSISTSTNAGGFAPLTY